MSSECINDCVSPSEIAEPPQPKRYVSKHPGNMPPSYSTFNTKNTNLIINNVGGHQILHKGYLKHHALWGKPKFESTEELIFPIGIVPPEQCHLKQPQIWKHYKYKADPQLFKTYLQNKKPRPKTAQPRQMENYLKKNDFGKVPEYLQNMQNAKAAKDLSELQRKQKKDQSQRNKRFTKYDVIQLITSLNKKKQDLLKEHAQYSHKRAMTEQTKRRKEELEKQLDGIDQDIKKLELRVQ